MSTTPFNPFGNGGVGSVTTGRADNTGALPSANPNPVVDQLIKSLQSAAQTQQQRIFPQQLPPNQVKAGDVSGNFVNPSTSGGPAHNARITLAQNIGNAAASLYNKHEQKESRDLAFQISTFENNINTMNDPSASEQQKAIAQEQINNMTPQELKKISKALGIQLFGEDKRTKVEQNAAKIAQQMSSKTSQNGNASGNPQPNANAGQPKLGQENLGIPQGITNPLAKQFIGKLPVTSGLTPQAQAMAQLTKAGVVPSASDILKFASDQQYYQMMTQKFGEEQAQKFAKMQQDYEIKMRDLAQKAQNEEDKTKQNEIMDKIREETNSRISAIQNERIGLLQQQVDLQKTKTDETVKNTQIRSLQTQGSMNRALIQSQTQILDQAQRSKNKTLMKQAQDQLDKLNKNQEKINNQLQTFGVNNKDSKSGDDDSAFNSIWGSAK